MTPSERVLRLREVKSKVGLSRTMIYELISRGDFPASVAISPRSVGWLESELDNWIASRKSQRDAKLAAK